MSDTRQSRIRDQSPYWSPRALTLAGAVAEVIALSKRWLCFIRHPKCCPEDYFFARRRINTCLTLKLVPMLFRRQEPLFSYVARRLIDRISPKDSSEYVTGYCYGMQSLALLLMHPNQRFVRTEGFTSRLGTDDSCLSKSYEHLSTAIFRISHR